VILPGGQSFNLPNLSFDFSGSFNCLIGPIITSKRLAEKGRPRTTCRHKNQQINKIPGGDGIENVVSASFLQ
jgi:hypothetical protein